MSQALYYKPSYERLQQRITDVAPDLEIALYQEGCFFLNGKEVAKEALSPEYFWIHSELFKSPEMKKYFNLVLDFPTARWLHTVNTGLDILPYISLLEKGVTVTNNHSQAIAISEYVIGQVFAHFQQLAKFKESQEEKIWKFRPSREMYGTRWLLIGFGHIGQAIAKRLKAFGVEITAIRRSSESEGLADEVLTLDQLDQALPKADVVVLACTANSKTRNLVDKSFLAQMKEKSVLVNIARGDIIVEEELQQALDQGIPECAILDVFRQEPLSTDSWMWHHPRINLTPHCSNASSGTRTRSEDLFISNLEKMVKGESLLNQVSEADIT